MPLGNSEVWRPLSIVPGMQNNLKDIWDGGGTATGGWLGLADAVAAELVGRVGFDYLCIDMQHGLADYSSALSIIQTLESSPSTTIARVPWNEPGIIGRILDAGAKGIIIPMVNSPEEAEAAVNACRYAPQGSRSWGPTRIGGLYADYSTDDANAMIACIPMIETARAVDEIDDIISVPGIDAIYVGPSDLSITLGQTPDGDNEGDFAEAIDRILGACDAHGVVPGIHASPALFVKRKKQGFRMITVCNDTSALVSGATKMLDDARTGATGPATLY